MGLGPQPIPKPIDRFAGARLLRDNWLLRDNQRSRDNRLRRDNRLPGDNRPPRAGRRL